MRVVRSLFGDVRNVRYLISELRAVRRWLEGFRGIKLLRAVRSLLGRNVRYPMIELRAVRSLYVRYSIGLVVVRRLLGEM